MKKLVGLLMSLCAFTAAHSGPSDDALWGRVKFEEIRPLLEMDLPINYDISLRAKALHKMFAREIEKLRNDIEKDRRGIARMRAVFHNESNSGARKEIFTEISKLRCVIEGTKKVCRSLSRNFKHIDRRHYEIPTK
ncbi:hypothetical protein HOD08_02385 [bacterium]|nr:hypothetical protein [bacterium]